MKANRKAALAVQLQQAYRHRALQLSQKQALRYMAATLHTVGYANGCEINIRMVNAAESQQLNRDYRHKDKPTNVLSFCADLPPDIAAQLPCPPLGDLVLCVPVVLAEAAAQQKSVEAHLAHLLVHGCLHLLGYDHETNDDDANHMEGLEIGTLARLGFSNPYA